MIGHFRFRIALALGDGHEERRIGSDRQRTCFVGIYVGVVNDNHSARWKRREGFPQKMFHTIGIPIVKNVGEKMDVTGFRERINKHVAKVYGDAISEPTLSQTLLGDSIHRGFFEDSSSQMRVAGDDGAGVYPRAS